jgi:hypothetical protein
MKKFFKALRPDLKVRRSGLLGLGRKVTVSDGSLTYTVDGRGASEETARLINSKMPTAILIPPSRPKDL